MAHDIWRDEKGRDHMMYVGEVPWHKLGLKLDKPATSAVAIKAAGLDYEVRKVPLFAIEGRGVASVQDYMATVPADRWGKPDCPVFGIVGKDYRVLQNREAFAFFDSIVGEGAAVYHTAGALGHGERIWVLAKLPGLLSISEKDTAEKYVLFSTGHDGSTAVRVILTAVRVVCQNTLTLALETGTSILRAHHTHKLYARLDDARLLLKSLLDAYAQMEETCRAMLKVHMTDDEVGGYFDRVIPAPANHAKDTPLPKWITADRAGCFRSYKKSPGTDIPGVVDTLWAAYNGVTHYYDHCREYESSRLYGTLFGRGLTMKNRAYRAAVNWMAEPAALPS